MLIAIVAPDMANKRLSLEDSNELKAVTEIQPDIDRNWIRVTWADGTSYIFFRDGDSSNLSSPMSLVSNAPLQT